jgi:hypothetical protein
VTEPARLVHGSLDCGSADTSDGRNLVDRPVAHTVTLYLKRHDAQDSSLDLSVVVPQIVRQRARTAKRPPAVARCLPVGGPLALAGSESAKHPAAGLADLAGMTWSRTAPQGTPRSSRVSVEGQGGELMAAYFLHVGKVVARVAELVLTEAPAQKNPPA